MGRIYFQELLNWENTAKRDDGNMTKDGKIQRYRSVKNDARHHMQNMKKGANIGGMESVLYV